MYSHWQTHRIEIGGGFTGIAQRITSWIYIALYATLNIRLDAYDDYNIIQMHTHTHSVHIYEIQIVVTESVQPERSSRMTNKMCNGFTINEAYHFAIDPIINRRSYTLIGWAEPLSLAISFFFTSTLLLYTFPLLISFTLIPAIVWVIVSLLFCVFPRDISHLCWFMSWQQNEHFTLFASIAFAARYWPVFIGYAI